MSEQKHRLLTRSDMDGIVSAVLLKEIGLVEEVKFVHPKDMQDGTIDVLPTDITTNLPYVDGVHLCFDHHTSEKTRLGGKRENHILDPSAPSAARVVYDYYGGREKFEKVTPELIEAVDKIDSAQLNENEILKPEGWILLGYLMDARTGLGRFHEYRISNYQLMMDMVDILADHQTAAEVLALPDVKERVDLYQQQVEKFNEQVKRCATQKDNLVVLDLREEEEIYAGNRFMIYALYPEANISMHVMWGRQKQNTVFAVGKSVLDRSSKTNVGELMLEYGGGGHNAAGTCQIDNTKAEVIMEQLIGRITAEG